MLRQTVNLFPDDGSKGSNRRRYTSVRFLRMYLPCQPVGLYQRNRSARNLRYDFLVSQLRASRLA